MLVGLHDADKTSFPNLVLMKLSAFYKAQNVEVGWYKQDVDYSIIYSSKVFNYTDDELLPSNTLRGGIGYGKKLLLPLEVEHLCPDYSLYNLDTSYGFLTRGCPNKCGWCVVPDKEGDIRKHAYYDEFVRHNKVIFLDNNVLAHAHGIEEIERLKDTGIKVDFNQGLDARLIDDGIARRLSKLKWLSPLRLACDKSSQIQHVYKAVQLLRWHNCTPQRYFVYLLVKDVDEALERVKFLKGIYCDPFAQPYRDIKDPKEPTKLQKGFARWVNHKAIFNSVSWEEYKIERNLTNC